MNAGGSESGQQAEAQAEVKVEREVQGWSSDAVSVLN